MLLLVLQLLEKDKPQFILCLYQCLATHSHASLVLLLCFIALCIIYTLSRLLCLKGVALVKIHYDNNEV